jgi:virulence-associated protein VapD
MALQRLFKNFYDYPGVIYMSLSSDVKDLEEKCTAYGKVFSIIKKELESRGFEEINGLSFFPKVEYFKELHLNMSLSYCPFPYDCNYYERCIEKNCNADLCDNGHARRGY